MRLANLKKRQTSLNSKLARENSISEELVSLDTKFRMYESEFQMTEHALKRIYLKKCKSLDEFIPVMGEMIVACRTKNTIAEYEGVIHVPTSGNHKLVIEAVETNFRDLFSYNRAKEKVVWSDSFSLAGGSSHSIAIYKPSVVDQKLRIKLTGQEDKLISFPYGEISASGSLNSK